MPSEYDALLEEEPRKSEYDALLVPERVAESPSAVATQAPAAVENILPESLAKPARAIGETAEGFVKGLPQMLKFIKPPSLTDIVKGGLETAATMKTAVESEPFSQEWWNAVVPLGAQYGMQVAGVRTASPKLADVAFEKPPIQTEPVTPETPIAAAEEPIAQPVQEAVTPPTAAPQLPLVEPEPVVQTGATGTGGGLSSQSWYRGHVEGQPLGKTETFISSTPEQAAPFASQVGGKVSEIRFNREPNVYPEPIPWDEYQRHWKNSALLKGYDAVRVIEPNGQAESLAVRNTDILETPSVPVAESGATAPLSTKESPVSLPTEQAKVSLIEEPVSQTGAAGTGEAHPLQGNVYYRGSHPLQKGGDTFYSADRSTAEEYSAHGATPEGGKVSEVTGESLPTKLYNATNKEQLAEELGIKGDTRGLDFDTKVKSQLQKQGYEGVRYSEGTSLGDEIQTPQEEVHVFGKPSPVSEADVSTTATPLTQTERSISGNKTPVVQTTVTGTGEVTPKTSTIRGQEMSTGDDVRWMSGGTWDGKIQDIVKKPNGKHDVTVKATNGETFTLQNAEDYGINSGRSKFITDANKPSYEGWEQDYPDLVPSVPESPVSTTAKTSQEIPTGIQKGGVTPETPAEPPTPIVTEQPIVGGTPQKPSKIGQSIEAKAVEAKLTQGFAETAGYDPLTIKDQAQRATDLIKQSVPDARAIVRGEAPLPEGLRGTSVITAMEEHLLKKPDAQMAYELANSPLTSATSAAAQEMRLMAERVPDGIAAKFNEIRRARTEGLKLRGETSEKVAADIGKEIVRQSSKRPTWEAFVREIVC